jgi:FAD/FMN-containing dehydrogenase
MSSQSIDIARLDGGSKTYDRSRIADLRRKVGDRVIFPDDDGWSDAILTWNGMAAKVPAVVIQPTSPADVAAVVNFARDQGLLLSVKGGGHNIAGTSIAQRGIALEMSRMRTVSVDPVANVVHAGPGCLLGDVDRATQEHGRATVLGFVSQTGVAGLTLGGGWGYLTRRFGYSVDNLQEVEIVTADGKLRVANREEHDDLFWAVRGGGGNFGIVTRFTFRLHEVGPVITGGLAAWSAERVDDVLQAYRELTSAAPRELTAVAVIRAAPPAPFVPQEWHGKLIAAMLICYSGDNAEAALAPIHAIGDPVVNLITPRPYVVLQSMLDANEPKGLHRYWKTEYLPGLSGEYLAAFRDGALKVTSPLSQSIIFHLDGALNERNPDDGAVGNRDARFASGFSGTWPPDKPAEPHITWVRSSWEKIRRYSTGGNYINFQLADDDMGRLSAAYGSNFERLRRVKAAYDPDNLFRVNRNIIPATSDVKKANGYPSYSPSRR